MSDYRIVTRDDYIYPYGIELKIKYFYGLFYWISFTKYRTLEEAREAKNRFKENDLRSKQFKKEILE